MDYDVPMSIDLATLQQRIATKYGLPACALYLVDSDGDRILLDSHNTLAGAVQKHNGTIRVDVEMRHLNLNDINQPGMHQYLLTPSRVRVGSFSGP